MRNFLLLFAVICTSYSALANATVAQKEWRWRNDDGNEASATWKAPQDQALTLGICSAIGQNLRLRMVMQVNPDPSTTNPASKNVVRRISYSTSPSGPWTTITPTGSPFIFSRSGYVTDGTGTTNQLASSGGVNGAGYFLDSTSNTTIVMSTPSGVTTLREYEWVIQPTANVQATTYYFMLTGLDSYPNTLPSVTFVGGPSASTQNVSACSSYISPAGNTWAMSGIYNETIENVYGCDSVITTNLTINQPTTATDVQSACDSYTWIDGVTYTESNDTATFTLQNAAGCDSIVTLDLTINYSTTGTDSQFACGSYTWIDGVTYTESNDTATFTLENAAGCDSIVTLDLTVAYPTFATDSLEACDSLTWIDGITYTASNDTATFTLQNAAGCDSIVTLNLTITNSTTATDVRQACSSLTWIDGVTYTESNDTATFVLTNAAGCDSIVTLNLTIGQLTGTDIQEACGSYEWIDGVTYTMSNNTATYTLESAEGCDSTVTLNLTINYPTTGVDVQESCSSFLWIDGVNYVESNNTATFTLQNAAGCDSVVTLNLTINHVDASVTMNANVLSATNTTADAYQWIDCGTWQAIPGATGATFTPVANGSYAVSVTEGNCAIQSSCMNITTIGLNEQAGSGLSIQVVPNPTSGVFSVSFAQETTIGLAVIDVHGKTVYTQQALYSGEPMDISALENGIYFVHIQTAAGTAVERIVKK